MIEYIGLFISSLVGSATIIFPVPYLVLVFSSGAILDPLLVALVTSIGATIGELTSYIIGLGGNKTILKKYKKKINKLENTFQKYGGPTIIIFAATPLPFDLLGLFCGAIQYNWKKFICLTFIGKFILHLVIAYAGLFSITWIIEILGILG